MPEQLGHYNLLERVGDGALGTEFRARDTVVGRTVLVKVAAERVARDPVERSRLLKDARAAATVSHPNVATLFEVGEHENQLFLVFEFVSGETLDQAYERSLDIRRVVDLGIQLAEALGAAHSQDVLHLDVRPSNIKVNLRGHAKLLGTGLSGWMTGTRAAPSAPSGDDRNADDPVDPYRSPEQRRGEPPDHRSDLFSLGVVLSEMLTARRSSEGAPSGRATPQRPAVPAELEAIVERAMAERVEDRYQSGLSFAAELRSLAAMLDVRFGDREPPALVTKKKRRSRRSSRSLFGRWRSWRRRLRRRLLGS